MLKQFLVVAYWGARVPPVLQSLLVIGRETMSTIVSLLERYLEPMLACVDRCVSELVGELVGEWVGGLVSG